MASDPDVMAPASLPAYWLALLQSPEALLQECRRETYQGSGAGGQKRNRVRSGVRLVHAPTGLRAENCEHREALRNVEAAARGLRLAMALRVGEIASERAMENPGESAGGRGGESSDFIDTGRPKDGENPPFIAAHRARFRVEANPHHEDYAVTAALALATLAQKRGRLADTAQELGVSGSALTRHFKAEKSVWAAVLRLREKMGLPALK